MKTLLTIALTSMMAMPAFAASETDNIKAVTDVYVKQHNIDVNAAMKTQINKDILSAINNFRVPLLTTSADMIAKAEVEFDESTEQADIE